MQYFHNLQIFANYKDSAGSGELVFSNKTFVVHLLNVCPIFQRSEMQHLCSVFGMNYFARNVRMNNYLCVVIKCLVSGTLLTTWIICMAVQSRELERHVRIMPKLNLDLENK